MSTTLAIPTPHKLALYGQLIKPGVLSLVVFSAYVGLLLAPGHIGFVPALLCMTGIALASAGSAAMNMSYDHDMDALMQRTQKRPTAQGLVSPKQALTFGVCLSALGTLLLLIFANILAAFWLSFSVFFYSYVYTVCLKRHTDQNIVIGGFAGALPPLIGWCCVDTHFHILPWTLVLLIFLWTPPHFWALSLYASDDYKKANIPMLVITQGAAKTRLWILIYALILTLPVIIPVLWGYLGTLYAWGSGMTHCYFLYQTLTLYKHPSHAQAKHTFLISIVYLFALLLFMLADRLV